MARVADYIMERVLAEGAEHIFTVTGRGSLFLSDAVARLRSMECVSVHHEQSAAYAAVAYSAYTGRLGACLVSTGCAATNTLSGVLSAWQDGIPCIFISGQNTLRETSHYTGLKIRTYGQQELDIIPMVRSITKYAAMITDPSQVRFELEKALHLAMVGRKGPVWIDVPLDVQSMRIEPEELPSFNPGAVSTNPDLADAVAAVRHALRSAKRPVVLVGSGVRSASAIPELETLVEACQIPVAFTGSAADTYGTENRLSIGSVGTMGCSRAGNFAVQNSDFLLVLGNRLSSMSTGTDYAKFARAAHVVVVDIDPVEHSKDSIRIDNLIVADVRVFLQALGTVDLKQTEPAWVEKCLHWKAILPRCESQHRQPGRVDLYDLADCLSHALFDDSIVLTDSGFTEVIVPTNLSFGRGIRCIHPASQGAMGFALPAVVGAYFASKRPVVAVIGDGSIMMNLQELQTIHHHAIPAKIFVINNNVYGIIRKRQVDMFRSRTIGTDNTNGVSCPDFKSVAQSFGLPYALIEDNTDLTEKLRAVLAMDGPVLCEILGLEDQDYIEVSQARTAAGNYVRRPLEDQAPFLDRDLFLREMVIDAIDQ